MTENFLTVSARYLGRRINLRQFPADKALATTPLIVEHGDGYVALFRYGVAVFFNLAPLEQQVLVEKTLPPFLTDPVELHEEETIELHIAPDAPERFHGNRITLKDPSVQRLQIVAEVLARSVLLAYYERLLGRTFDQVEPLAEKMARSRGPRTGSHLLKAIGSALVTEHDMVGRAEVLEKPELLWERSDLEGLFLMLEDEFELRERDAALSRKLELVSRTAQTSLELLQARRSLRVEWYIVILIVIDIILGLFEKFFQSS